MAGVDVSLIGSALKKRGFDFYTGVPCSFLKPLINHVLDDPDMNFVKSASEGEAVGIACGAYLGGKKPVVMLQNSGLGNTVNPLTSLAYIYKIPLLVIVTWRGDPDFKDEPQHELMGVRTQAILSAMDIPCGVFQPGGESFEELLAKAEAHFSAASLPFAIIVKKDSISPYSLKNKVRSPFQRGKLFPAPENKTPELLREDIIRAIVQHAGDEDAIVSTTGKTSRELLEVKDRIQNFYVVGSMGCASGIALGAALAQPSKRFYVLDGDGALLMKMGALSTIGHVRPPSFIHICIDNEAHESTGAQSTSSGTTLFEEVAHACGYATSERVAGIPELAKAIERAKQEKGPHFILIKAKVGSREDLKRPTHKPPQITKRFRDYLTASEPVSASR